MSGREDNVVVGRLEVARKELLDLGLRNPLLNYRPLRSRGVEVVDERPEEVFRHLVGERKAMTFLPASEELQLALLDPPAEASAPTDEATSAEAAPPEAAAEPATPAARHL